MKLIRYDLLAIITVVLSGPLGVVAFWAVKHAFRT